MRAYVIRMKDGKYSSEDGILFTLLNGADLYPTETEARKYSAGGTVVSVEISLLTKADKRKLITKKDLADVQKTYSCTTCDESTLIAGDNFCSCCGTEVKWPKTIWL